MSFLTLLLLFSITIQVESLGFPYYSPDVFPDSYHDLKRCGVTSKSSVCDPDNILGEEGVNLLHGITKSIESSTNCSCLPSDTPLGTCSLEPRGYIISVAVLSKIYVYSRSEGIKHDLERIFPDALRRKQDRGQCDDDILIVLALKNNVIATSVGSVARRKLHSEVVDKVIELARFRYLDQNEYAKGLHLMIEIFGKVLSGQNYLEALPSKVERMYLYRLKRLIPNWPLWLTLLLLIGIPAFMVIVITICAVGFALRKYLRVHRYRYLHINRQETSSPSTSLL